MSEVANIMDRAEMRLFQAGAQLQKKGEVLEDFPVRHVFTPGMYARELTMPGGAIAMSKVHKTEHMFIVSKGRYSVFMEGHGFQYIEAPYLGITKPGDRRLFLVHEETVLTTFHPTWLRDLEKIEEELVEQTLSDLGQHELDRIDYAYVLQDHGLRDEQVREVGATAGHVEGIDEGLAVKASPIHGSGLFAERGIQAGTRFVAFNQIGKVTVVGRYANHSARPNCKMVRDRSNRIYLMPTEDIAEGEELTVNYRQVGREVQS